MFNKIIITLFFISCVTIHPTVLPPGNLISCKLVGQAEYINLIGCQHSNPTQKVLRIERMSLKAINGRVLSHKELLKASEESGFDKGILTYSAFFNFHGQGNETAIAAAAVLSLLAITQRISATGEVGSENEEKTLFYLEDLITLHANSNRRSIFAIKNDSPNNIQDSFEICIARDLRNCRTVSIQDELRVRRRVPLD